MRNESTLVGLISTCLLALIGCGPPAYATLELSGAVERTVQLESSVGMLPSINGPQHFTMYEGEGARLIVSVGGDPRVGEVELDIQSIAENLREGSGAQAFVHRIGWRNDARKPIEIHGYFGGSILTVAGDINLGGTFYMRADSCHDSGSKVACGSGGREGDPQRFTNAQSGVSIFDTESGQNNITIVRAFTDPWFTEGEDLIVTGTFENNRVTFEGGEAIPCVQTWDGSDDNPVTICGAEKTIEHRGCDYFVTILVQPTSVIWVAAGQDPACEKERISYNAQLGVAE